MQNKKHKIEVRRKETIEDVFNRVAGIEKASSIHPIIYRKLFAENLGNFNFINCRYKNKKYTVKSDKGDLADPFRREENYLNNLFIEV